MRLRWLVVPVAVCAAFGVVACGSSSGGGAGTTTATVAAEPSFDPCAIPEDALRGVAVDPATKEADVFGVKYPGWHVCSWDGNAGWYYLSVFSTARGINEVRSNPRNSDFAPVQVGGRQAFTYHETDDAKREMCDVAFGDDSEATLVRAQKKGSEDAQEDLCAVAVRAAQGLDPALPAH